MRTHFSRELRERNRTCIAVVVVLCEATIHGQGSRQSRHRAVRGNVALAARDLYDSVSLRVRRLCSGKTESRSLFFAALNIALSNLCFSLSKTFSSLVSHALLQLVFFNGGEKTLRC